MFRHNTLYNSNNNIFGTLSLHFKRSGTKHLAKATCKCRRFQRARKLLFVTIAQLTLFKEGVSQLPIPNEKMTILRNSAIIILIMFINKRFENE